jgi:hypothetical protein
VFTTNALDLHLNLLNQIDVEMTFWIADSFDETDNDDGIYFSDDGGSTFVKVLDLFPSEWCNNLYGQHPPIDVDGLAASAGLNMTSQFVIRFQQRGEDDFGGNSATSEDGFFLDEVKVHDPGLIYHDLSQGDFEDDFDNGLLKESWAWNFADETSTISSNFAITSPMSMIEVQDGIGINNTYGVAIGRRCDNVFTTNALDLHLNLLNQTDVEMTFWIADSFDETDNDDGIYFSDDGGISFIKVFDFDFSISPNNVFEEYQIPISALMTTNGLEPTENFVIRFQQRGEDDFSGNSATSEDGFYLDDVNITGMTTSIVDISKSKNLVIFPNPSSEKVNVEIKNDISNQNMRIEIFDILGNPIHSRIRNLSNGKYLLDISTIPTGVYFISILFTDGEKYTEKLIKR